ncbi:unnamed protein product [Diamesa serratosioi]
MKFVVVILLIFSACTVQSMFIVPSNDDANCIVHYLKMKGLIQSKLSYENYSGTQEECNEIIRKEVDEFYHELNTKKFEHLSVYKMNDGRGLRQCMTNIYKRFNVSDYYLKGKIYQHLNSTDFEVDPNNALDTELPRYSSMMCQIDKYVTYHYDLFAEALNGTEGETQEKDCLVEHLIELKKLPSGLRSLIAISNDPNCITMNNKHYESIRENYKTQPSETLFRLQPSKTYQLCVRNKTTKEHSVIMQFVFNFLPQERVNEQQKKQIKDSLEQSMKTFAKIHFQCLQFY